MVSILKPPLAEEKLRGHGTHAQDMGLALLYNEGGRERCWGTEEVLAMNVQASTSKGAAYIMEKMRKSGGLGSSPYSVSNHLGYWPSLALLYLPL